MRNGILFPTPQIGDNRVALHLFLFRRTLRVGPVIVFHEFGQLQIQRTLRVGRPFTIESMLDVEIDSLISHLPKMLAEIGEADLLSRLAALQQ